MTLWDSTQSFAVRLTLVGLVMTAGCTLRSGGPPTAVSSDKAGGAATELVRLDSPPAIQLPDLPPERDDSDGWPQSTHSDDDPHDVLTEWWYYTGHLWTGAGERFGFEFVVFQTVRGPNPVGYLSHFAITDEANGRFAYDARGTQRAQIAPSLDLNIDGWRLTGGGGTDRFEASMFDYGLELSLISFKPPSLHAGGLISFGPAGDSYYFSRTRMSALGSLRRGDTRTEVVGEAWHDHQWGNFIVPAVGGWDWVSLQLDGSRELMLTVLRAPDGDAGGAFGSFVDSAGRTIDVPGDAILLQPLATWTSPRTGTAYPSGWIATIAESAMLPAMRLTISPVLANQELAFERIPYWEGAVDVVGVVDGADTQGWGYVELTGYAR